MPADTPTSLLVPDAVPDEAVAPLIRGSGCCGS